MSAILTTRLGMVCYHLTVVIAVDACSSEPTEPTISVHDGFGISLNWLHFCCYPLP